MAPVVHGLEAQYFGKVNFVYLDIDDPANANFKREFGFRYQPEFYLIDGQGKVVQKWIGFVDEKDFVTAFSQILGQ